MVTVLFIHSAGSQGPGEGSNRLLNALAAALPAGLTLVAPAMPDPDNPEAEPWLAALQSAMGRIEGRFLIVGHSLGGSVTLQGLARDGMPINLAGVILVATPFWGPKGWNMDSFALPGNAAETLAALPALTILQGDKDDVVSADHPDHYKDVLPFAKSTILAGVDHEALGAVPALVDAIVIMADIRV
jgi:predicted alpha/beta hydrolase family esterase